MSCHPACTRYRLHRESKNKTLEILSTTFPDVNRFSTFTRYQTGRLGDKFAANSYCIYTRYNQYSRPARMSCCKSVRHWLTPPPPPLATTQITDKRGIHVRHQNLKFQQVRPGWVMQCVGLQFVMYRVAPWPSLHQPGQGRI